MQMLFSLVQVNLLCCIHSIARSSDHGNVTVTELISRYTLLFYLTEIFNYCYMGSFVSRNTSNNFTLPLVEQESPFILANDSNHFGWKADSEQQNAMNLNKKCQQIIRKNQSKCENHSSYFLKLHIHIYIQAVVLSLLAYIAGNLEHHYYLSKKYFKDGKRNARTEMSIFIQNI